jgi:drug/metabolite transporter (DMT)-like permease
VKRELLLDASLFYFNDDNKNKIMNENTKARAGVLLANFFFGTSVIAVKHISPSLMPPFALTAVRIIVTMLLFWSMYAMRPVKMGITKKDFIRLLHFVRCWALL